VRSNADIVRESILAQNAGDDEAMLAALHDEVDFNSPEQRFRGVDAMRRTLEQARRDVGELRITLHELEERGDAVLVIGSITAQKGLNVPRAWIWQLREGRAFRIDSFPNREQAHHAWRRLHDS
jgi:ketosteroid isomerase-like protein